jgi:uncharacterized protein YukE
LRGRHFADVQSWDRTVERYSELLATIRAAAR